LDSKRRNRLRDPGSSSTINARTVLSPGAERTVAEANDEMQVALGPLRRAFRAPLAAHNPPLVDLGVSFAGSRFLVETGLHTVRVGGDEMKAHSEETTTGNEPRAEILRALGALRKDLYKRALGLTRNQDLADDLAQEACLRALRSSSTYRSGTNLSAWLNRILQNAFLDDCRRPRRLIPVAPVELASYASDPPLEDVRPAYDLLSRGDVIRGLKKLSAADRQILDLALIRRQSYRDISATMNLRTETVGTRVHRAKKRLRSRLEANAVRQSA
jgi:RNA polymerase sigma-70 factor (ECF subfamily)